MLQEGIIVYLALFAMLLAGSVGFPIPEDIPLILGGILSQQGTTRLSLTFLVCYLGIVIGDLIIFSAGRKVGPALFNRNWFKLRLPPEKLEKIRLRLENRRILMIFVARHLFYLRTVTFLMCGAVKMKFSHFLIADLIAALISASIMISLGYLAAENYKVILFWIDKLKFYTLIPVILAIIALYIYYKRKNRQG